jgi:hypothetical protein
MLCGFDFSEQHRASYSREEDVPAFFINPDLLCKEVKEEINPFINRMYLKRDLMLCAAHEVTHLQHEYHDSSFVARLEWVQTQTWKSEKLYVNIITEAFRKN